MKLAAAGDAVKPPQPPNVFLRRAARVTLLVPLMFWFTSDVLKLQPAGLPASFALFSVLVFANLGGPPLARFRANVTVVLVGLVVVAAGALAGLSVWTAIPATLLAVFAIAYSGVLRGYFGAATSAVIVPWILGAASGSAAKEIPAMCLGWLLGGAVACIAASAFWPVYEQSRLRQRLADVLDAAAVMVDDRWNGPGYSDDAMATLDASIAALHAEYDGVIGRPGGGTARERSMMLAVDEVQRLRTALWADQGQPDSLRACDAKLAGTTATCLREAATALRGRGTPPDPQRLDSARATHQRDLEVWVGTRAAGPAAAGADGAAALVYPALGSTFDIRLMSLTAELVAFDVRRSLLGDKAAAVEAPAVGPRTDGAPASPAITVDGKPIFDLDHRATVGQRLAGQWSLSSPWFRVALRTAVAIAATVLIVKATKIEFSFWVSLGAMAALKFDASGTRRSGTQIVLGTFGGFLVGAVILTVVGDRPAVYWVILPFAVFLAAYTPGKATLAVGQGAFTVFLITMIAISNPGKYVAGEMRVVNVALGVSVSLIVSALMWPRGAAAMVRQTIRTGADQAGAFFVSACRLLADGEAARPANDETRAVAARAVAEAVETLDLAVSQRGPGLEDVWEWMLVLNTASHLMYGGVVLTSMATVNPLPPGCEPSRRELVAASEHARVEVDAAVDALALGEHRAEAANNSAAARIRLWAAINQQLAHESPPAVADLVTAAQSDTIELMINPAAPSTATPAPASGTATPAPATATPAPATATPAPAFPSAVPTAAGEPHQLGREAIALAFATGWAIQANQLADRLAVLARA